MALIRTILQHPKKQCWAFVEYSDENREHCIVLGSMEFATEGEAREYAKGFEPFSYEWKPLHERELKKRFRKRETFQVFELTTDVVHPLVTHYGKNGIITSDEQTKTYACVGNLGAETYGSMIVIDQNEKCEAFTKEQFKKIFVEI